MRWISISSAIYRYGRARRVRGGGCVRARHADQERFRGGDVDRCLPAWSVTSSLVQSKVVPRRLSRRRDEVSVGLWTYLCVYCVLVGSIGFAVYKLMQPERYLNPGVAASTKSTVVAGIGDVPQFQEPDNAVAIASAKLVGQAASQKDGLKKLDPAAAKRNSKRPRTVPPRERHDPMMDYAARYPSSYQFWNSYQSWNSYRPGTSFRSWDNYRPAGGQRPWDSRRP